MKKFLFSLLLCTILMAGCVGVTPVAETPTSTVAPIPTELPIPEVEPIHPGLEIISPENVDRLEELGKWGESIVYDIAIAPDRKTIATRTVDGIHFYNSQTLEEVNFIESKSDYTANQHFSVSYSSDGKYLAASGNYYVSIINLATGENEKRIYSPLPGANGDTYITDVEISPDNRHAVVTSETISFHCDGKGNNFALYDITTEYGKLLFDRYVCGPDMSRFRFTSDNHIYFFLWAATVPYPYQMDVVDLDTGWLAESISFDYRSPDPLKTFYDVSPDGKVFASADYKDYNETTHLIDVNTGNVLQTIEGSYIAFAPTQDGSYTWHEMKKMPLRPNIPGCAIIPNDRRNYEEIFSTENSITLLVSTSYKYASIEVWNIQKCELARQISYVRYYPPSYGVTGEFNSNGTLFAKQGGEGLEVWNTITNRLKFVARSSTFRSSSDVFTFNEDGTRLITGTTQDHSYANEPITVYSLDIWNVQTGLLLSTIKTEEKFLTSLVPTSDPNMIAAVDQSAIIFWNIKTGDKVSSFPTGNLTINPNEKSAWILHQEEQSLSLYDIGTGNKLRSIPVPDALEFYMDQNGVFGVVLYRSSPYLAQFDLRTGKELLRVEVSSVTTLKGQGSFFFTYGSDRFNLWNFQSNLPIQSINGISGRNLVISPNSRILVSNLSYPSTMLGIWDIQSGKLITEVSTWFEITDAQFSPDGRLLVFGGEDGFIHVWGVRKP